MWFFASYITTNLIGVWFFPDELAEDERESGMYCYSGNIHWELFGPPAVFMPTQDTVALNQQSHQICEIPNVKTGALFFDLLKSSKRHDAAGLFYNPKSKSRLTPQLKLDIELEFYKYSLHFKTCSLQSKTMMLVAPIHPQTTGMCLNVYCNDLECANYYPCQKHTS